MIGPIKYFLGLNVQQIEKGIFINQSKYVKEILNKFKMDDCKPVGTPMITGCKLTKEDNSPAFDITLYKSMIDKLIYLTQTRPDISNAVGIVGRFATEPKQSHLMK